MSPRMSSGTKIGLLVLGAVVLGAWIDGAVRERRIWREVRRSRAPIRCPECGASIQPPKSVTQEPEIFRDDDDLDSGGF